MVITAVGDSSTQRGGGIGKSLGWENVVSPSNQVTVIVIALQTNMYTSAFMVPLLVLQGHVCPPKTNYVDSDIVLFVRILSVDCTLI